MMFLSKSPSANRWLWRIIVGGVVFIPVVFSWSGKDNFRLPKELVFRAEAILVFSICTALFFANKLRRPSHWSDASVIIPAGVVLWAFVCMLAATNRALSIASFLWVSGWALIFLVTSALAQDRRLPIVYFALVPAAVNAAFLLLQEADLWNPFFPGKSLEHAYHTGLIGNPNDAGTFLAAPTVACFALVFASSSHRLLHIALTLFLVIALVANHTLSALIALGAGFLATVFLVSRRKAVAAVIIACILAVGLVWFYPPLRFRYELATRFISARYYDGVLSGRIIPFVAAYHMFLDRPILGVGPGCFKWEFFPYKVRITDQYKKLALAGTTVNYGEVHNDHLQVLAETGLPGYALFVAALIAIGAASFKKSSSGGGPEAEFSRLASFPLAIAFAVIALGQFPLELAASAAVNLYLFALCSAWRPHARARIDD